MKPDAFAMRTFLQFDASNLYKFSSTWSSFDRRHGDPLCSSTSAFASNTSLVLGSYLPHICVRLPIEPSLP